MNYCNICAGRCVTTYTEKFYPKGERMVRSLLLGNYDVVMRRLYENPHLFLYEAGKYRRNVFRYAIYKIVSLGGCNVDANYAFIQCLLEFGRSNLTAEEYNEWSHSYNVVQIGVGTYYRYPIYKNDLKMIRFLLDNEIPFPSHILVACVSPSPHGSKFKQDFDPDIAIEMMIEFLSRGADPSGCSSNDLVSCNYFSYSFPVLIRSISCDWFKRILELLYIYEIEFDRGSKFINKSNFDTEEEYINYTCMMWSYSDFEGPESINWISLSFNEIIEYLAFLNPIADNCTVSNCTVSNCVGLDQTASNILYTFILYFSDKYDANFLSNELVRQYFDYILKNNIQQLIVGSINEMYCSNEMYRGDNVLPYYEIMENKMRLFINSVEQKIPFLLSLMDISKKNNLFIVYL